MSLSTSIMAHPSRAHLVGELLVQIPGVPVTWDREDDRWETGRRAMLHGRGTGGWHLVIQDDVVLCENFLSGVEAALKHVPEYSPAAFYTGRSRPFGPAVAMALDRAEALHKRWLKCRGPLWGPAVAVHSSRIPEMIEQCDDMSIANYDLRMASFFESEQSDCWYSIPSLVDHLVGPDNPSLVPGRGASWSRTAHRFIGDQDPASMDWSGGAFAPELMDELWYHTPAGIQCASCGTMMKDLVAAVSHAHEHYGDLGDGVAVHSSDLLVNTALKDFWRSLPERVRGESPYIGHGKPWLVIVGKDQDGPAAGELPMLVFEHQLGQARTAKQLHGAKISMKHR